ncbi:replicative helicase loader/inhibitor [Paenibacillus alvei]|uniref:Replicative helicase loader/inhibitor n=1 Tax=Paenibacillus alvei TaxID=44250 RepID=A0ABT4GWX3_PAEAL|nr:replicative helicase loader/inhibitor [Paenibacillus alvei]MCY9541827.1 replicative helicase loader/inhibitor [Paenibacillus alvei]MCY9704984.1 replicative helicase loader/inhibitor [Paenibacillus alvei]MCY9755319.1 replicative helicase loader/inhibitor [Paenibacillus alvei]MCY9761213.1 replicative helicase loader/inhibitor [Paenibacillus alvei]MCY9765742.1 replicative helicase loader/inhibitor [Paenibacillus alvei]
MNRAEVARLLLGIKQNYPSFDASAESVERHARYLRDIPFEVAKQNLDSHIMTERFPPTIADLRGRLGEQIERNRMKQETDEYFEKLDEWRKKAVPPPRGNLEKVRAILKRSERV